MQSIFWQIQRWFNTTLKEEVVFLFALPITLLVIFFAYRIGLKKLREINYLNDGDIVFFKKILKYKIILIVISALIWLPYPFNSIVYAPFGIISSILPLLVLIRVLRRKYKKIKSIDLLNINTQEDLNEKVERLLNSENFLTALRCTLPKGEKDEEYGLDYIPYMLKNIDERRQSFSKRARSFIITSVSVGLLFVGITIWLGYIILDEDSIGTGRKIRQLEDNTKELNEKMAYLSSDLYIGVEQFKKIENRARRIRNLVKNNNKLEKRDSILQAIEEFSSTKNADSLYSHISLIEIPYDKDSDINEVRFELDELSEEIEMFKFLQTTALKNFPQLVNNINATIENSRIEINQNENRTPEIIKRLILSVVIVSFFLAILKFLTNQYKYNFNQLVKSEYDDLYIRKIYVALKTAGSNEDSKKIILNNILKRLEEFPKKTVKESSENLSLVKDLIETLAKKL